jgi:hypothetical protein
VTGPQSRGHPPDMEVAPGKPDATTRSRFHTSPTADHDTADSCKDVKVTELIQGPRPWSHHHDGDCSTCDRIASLTARRRRQETIALTAGRRIVDLRGGAA